MPQDLQGESSEIRNDPDLPAPYRFTRQQRIIYDMLNAANGEPVAKKALLDVLYPGATAVPARSIDTQISNMKYKLQAIGLRIEKIRSAGYLLLKAGE